MNNSNKRFNKEDSPKQIVTEVFVIMIGLIQIIISLVFYPNMTSIVIGSLFGLVIINIGIIAALYDEEADSDQDYKNIF